ncbi:formin-like protein 8 [Primulina huaijiensis]|uniref:formin-like protein 8 n=1 Tax=Primulina huaijiensis TaxID=1492673 RepID=UPI003CC6EA2E
MAAQSKSIIQVVAITATISLLIAGIIVYLVYRFVIAKSLGKHRSDVGFCAGNFSGCCSKGAYNSAAKKPVPPTTYPLNEISDLSALKPVSQHQHPPFPISKTWRSTPSPPATPLTQMSISSKQILPQRPPLPPTPPPPPAPPRRKFNPESPPIPPKSKHALPAKTHGLISPHNPLIPSRGIEINSMSTEDPAMDKGKANEEFQTIDKGKADEEFQTRLKPLHWDKVTANTDHSMVWNEINDGSFRFDDALMESLFSYKTASKKSTNRISKSTCQGNSNLGQSAQMFILDPRNSQNTAIVLKSLAVSRKEILEALLEGQGLDVDTLEKLNKISPTQEEITKILEFSENRTELADAEFFLYQILTVVPSAFIRFSAMLFRFTYDQEILHLKECLHTLELGSQELRTGGIFFKLLEAILKVGNRMNAGTARGDAQGFNLNSLCRLSDVKSTNGKTTLLHFVVEQVILSEGKYHVINRDNKPGGISTTEHRQDKDKNSNIKNSEENDTECLMLGLQAFGCLGFEFSNVKKAATIDYDSFTNTFSTLKYKVDEIKQILTCGEVEQDEYLREMKKFSEDSEEELNLVRKEERRVIELGKKTTVYYQEGGLKNKAMSPLQLFVIVKDFLNMVDQVCAEIAKNLPKKKVAGPGSPLPLPPKPRSPVKFHNMKSYFLEQKLSKISSDSEDDSFLA